MGRVVHFEIPIDDPERAQAFYRDALGWKVQRWGPVEYWNVTTGEEPGPGVDGALTPRPQAPEGVLVYVGVQDLDAALDRVKQAGGSTVAAKTPIPSVGWSAHVRDTEGNLIGLFQEDQAAGR